MAELYHRLTLIMADTQYITLWCTVIYVVEAERSLTPGDPTTICMCN
jgi:hypothetical protein